MFIVNTFMNKLWNLFLQLFEILLLLLSKVLKHFKLKKYKLILNIFF